MTWPRDLQTVSTERVVELARQAKMLHEPWVQHFIRAIAHSDDPGLEEDFAILLRQHAIEAVLRDVPFTNPTQVQLNALLQAQHPVLFGLIRDLEVPFVQPIDWLNQHSVVLGGTGVGKTNLLYGMALQALRCGRNVMAIERNKTDMRHLGHMHPDLLVFNTRNFPYALLQVLDGIDPRQYIGGFVETFCKSHGLLDLSEGLALVTLTSLFEKHAILEGSQNWPTLYDWRQEIVDVRMGRYDRRQGARDSLLLRIDSYLFTMPELCTIERGPCVAEICENSFVWELTRESERQARFLSSLFLKSLYRIRVARNERVNRLRTLIIFDECKAAFPQDREDRTGYAPLPGILSTCREVGMGFLLSDQTADLNDAVFVQTRTKVCMRLGSGADIQKIERTFGLDRDQARFIPRLDVGEAIVRVPGIDEPFLIRIPRTRIH